MICARGSGTWRLQGLVCEGCVEQSIPTDKVRYPDTGSEHDE